MSRAFVKESDGAEEPLPPRRVSEHANLVTPNGLEQLKNELGRLTGRRAELLALGDDPAARDELRHLDRDLAYVNARLGSAELVDPAAQPKDEVGFGATVTVREAADGAEPAASRTYVIVGEDEAEAESGKVSYVSPLACALSGAHVGQSVVWKRPKGDLVLTVERIQYR